MAGRMVRLIYIPYTYAIKIPLCKEHYFSSFLCIITLWTLASHTEYRTVSHLFAFGDLLFLKWFPGYNG